MGDARCSCGAVTLSLPEEPSGIIVACHCIDCQRRTGAPFGVGAYYPANVVTISGTAKEFTHNAASGGASPSQLMEAVGTDTAGMSKLLDRLEVKGLIERRPNPSDRRSVMIELTERGLALVPELTPVFSQVARQLFDGFSDDEVANLTSSLRRMGENLKS